MTHEGPGDSDPPLPLSFSDIHGDTGEMCLTSHFHSSEVTHSTVARPLTDTECQGPPFLQPSSPRPSSVMPENSQTDTLPIRPFPLQGLLESYELSVLLSILEASDDGKCVSYPPILH